MLINEEEDNNQNLRVKNILDEKDLNLDDFYNRYIKRDNKYLKNSQFIYYLKPVLPDKFNNKRGINEKAEVDIKNQLKESAHELNNENGFGKAFTEVKDLIKEDRDDLLKLINTNFSNLENKNNYGTTAPYYISLVELLELPDIKKTCDNFAKLNNINMNENTKSTKLRAINRRNIFNDNSLNKDYKYDINNNLSEEKEKYGDIQYFSGGNALSGQKTEINDNNILKNFNTTYSNQFNHTENQFINTNNNVQNTNYSSFRTGPFPNTINQNEEKVGNQPYSSKIEGQGIIRDNNNIEENKTSKPLENNIINEEEAK